MKRRSFLSMLGAAGLAPMLPLPAGAAPAAAGYNRYMYGLAVFHARTRSTVSAADLMTRLRVSAGTAEAMLGEMTAKGVITPAVQAAGGVARAIEPHHGGGAGRLRSALRKAADWIGDQDTETDHSENVQNGKRGSGNESGLYKTLDSGPEDDLYED